MTESIQVIPGANATAKEYNDLQKDFLLGRKTLTTVEDAATMTFDLSVSNFFITEALTDDRTFVFDNVVTGQPFQIIVLQDATGNRQPVWPDILWESGGVEPSTSGAGNYDVFTFVRVDETNILGSFSGFGFV